MSDHESNPAENDQGQNNAQESPPPQSPPADQPQANNLEGSAAAPADNVDNSKLSDFEDVESSEETMKSDEPKSRSAVIPLFKLLLIYPGKIMRVVVQVGDLYYCIGITNIYVETLLILLCSSAEKGSFVKFLTFVITFMFSCLIGNPISLAYWEFAKLRWIKDKNPFKTLMMIAVEPFLPYTKGTRYDKPVANVTNVILGLFCWVYAIAAITYDKNDGSIFDVVNVILLFYIPAIKFGAYYIVYFVIAIYSIYKGKIKIEKNEDPITTAMKLDANTCCCGKGQKGKVFFIIKCVFAFISLIFLIVQFGRYKVSGTGGCFIIFGMWLFGTVISLAVNMPVWIVQIFYRWDRADCIHAAEGISKEIKDSGAMEGFKYWNILGTSLGFIVVLAFMAFLVSKGNGDFVTVQERLNKTGNFTGNAWTAKHKTDVVKSAMCYSKLFNLNYIQLSALTQATYMDNETEMLDLYKKSIFKDDSIHIDKMKFLTKTNDDAVMMQTDFSFTGSDQNLTVFSIRGSTTSLDWWLDLEIFASSAMLTVARWIPLIQRLESKTTKTLTAFFTIPLRNLEDMTLMKKYTDTLSEAYEAYLANPESEGRNIVFAGHSLAGGLSKYMGSKYKKNSFAVSGPGITSLEYKFKPEDGYNKYFKSTFIDIVPDNDFVPRLETSGGIKYRVLCEANGGSCHAVDQTICMMGLMCDEEEYTGDLCQGMFEQEYYEHLREVAEGKN